MAYFDTKSGSLEEAIRQAVGGQINEKVEYVEYKFKNKNDAMKAKNMLDGTQLMGFDINDDNNNQTTPHSSTSSRIIQSSLRTLI